MSDGWMFRDHKNDTQVETQIDTVKVAYELVFDLLREISPLPVHSTVYIRQLAIGLKHVYEIFLIYNSRLLIRAWV